MDFFGEYAVTDFKNCWQTLKGMLGKGGSHTNLITVKEFNNTAERLYRARRAKTFTNIASFGSMNDI